MTSTSPILDVKGVRYRWPGRSSFGLSISELSVLPGESVLITGESGSGKSTLLSLICGIVSPTTGHISIAGTELAGLSGRQKDQLRAENIGIIFQQFNLLPFATVRDNILLPLKFASSRRNRAGNGPQAAEKLCRDLGLSDLLSAQASRLSVGQQQRVAIARAMIGSPPIIVADEPTSALDVSRQSAFLDLLFEQTASQGSTLVMVSHDPQLGNRFDRSVRLKDIATVESVAA